MFTHTHTHTVEKADLFSLFFFPALLLKCSALFSRSRGTEVTDRHAGGHVGFVSCWRVRFGAGIVAVLR